MLGRLIAVPVLAVLSACASLPAGSGPEQTSLLLDIQPGHTLVLNVVVQCDMASARIYRQVRDRQVLSVPACGHVLVGVVSGREVVWGAPHEFDPGVVYRLTITHPVQFSSILHVNSL